jgi:hypothetical protein
MNTFRPFAASLLAAVLLPFLAGCGGNRPSGEWTTLDLIRALTNTAALARLDAPRAELHSSWDRTGGNDDFSHFPEDASAPEGWNLLADLEGPGYVSRFWSTGIPPEQVKLRFCFDGEKKPRLETTLLDYCAANAQVPYPVASGYTNLCHHNFAPVPYAKRLRIYTDAPREPGGKFYYQVNAAKLPAGARIASFAGRYSPEEEAALREVAAAWTETGRVPVGAPGAEPDGAVAVHLGNLESRTVLEKAGMGVVRELRVAFPDGFLDGPDAPDVLRGLVLSFTWDGASFPSAKAPLGDLCGVQGRLVRYRSVCWEIAGDSFFVRFPMPFRNGMKLEIRNQSGTPLDFRVSAQIDPLGAWDPALGYFHATWQRSGPQPGTRHPVASAKGRGRLAACVLGAYAADPRMGYWILESDESIRRDRETAPGWQGTGLEDYFNCGWYYPFAAAYPLFGVTFKIPFKTSQYRIHLPDAVTFGESLDMWFERGPGNSTPGWMESMAVYYLDSLQRSGSRIPATGIPPVPQPIDGWTFQHELWTAERFGDTGRQAGLLRRRLRQLATVPEQDATVRRETGLAELRLAALAGDVAALAAKCRETMEKSDDAAVRAAAEQLLHREEGGYLLHVFTTARHDIFLDGERIAGTPEGEAACFNFALPGMAPGRHVLAFREYGKPHPCTIAFAVSGPDGYLAAGRPGVCRRTYNLKGTDWAAPDFDDSGWEPAPPDCKGPPDDNDVAIPPDAFPCVYTAMRPIGFQPETFRNGTAHTRFAFDIP